MDAPLLDGFGALIFRDLVSSVHMQVCPKLVLS